MADIRFDRADRNRCPAVGADDRADGPDFCGIADLGASAMTFDEGDLVGIDAVAFVDRPEQVCLGFARRQGDAVGPAGGVDARRNDPGVAPVFFLAGAVRAAQHEHDAALGAHIACAIVVIGAAKPLGRKHARLSKADERQGMGENIDAANDRRIDLADVECPHRLIERDERGGTGRIDGHARAAQAENVRNAVGDDRQSVAGHEVRPGGSRIFDRQVGMVEARCADVNADILAVQRGRGDIGVFKRAPGKLQKHALLRIHIHGFALRHAENGRVEIIELIEYAGSEGIGLALCAHDRVPETCNVPAIGGDAGNSAFALTKKFEQRRRRFCSRGEACTPNNLNSHV